MWTRDTKQHIRCTKSALLKNDVVTILTALELRADSLRDATNAFPITQFWEGNWDALPSFQHLHSIALLDVGSVVVNIGKNLLNTDPCLDAAVKLFRLFPNAKESSLCLTGKVAGRLDSISLSISSLGPKLLVAFSHQSKSPIEIETTKEILSDLIGAGKWPISLHMSNGQLTALHDTGGYGEFRPQIREIQFECPGQSLRSIMNSMVQTIKQLRFTLRAGEWYLVPGDGQIASWRKASRFLEKLRGTGIPGMKTNLNEITWRLKTYKAFTSINELHTILNLKEQIMTRLVEFKLHGNSGFMELGHDHKGYYVWFSFDTEKPFTELQKIIGYPLKEWE